MLSTHNPKKVARSGAIYTIALIFQKILSFTYFSFVAGALGPEKLGTYVFALTFAALFQIAVDFGFVPMAIRTFAQNQDKQKQYFSTFLAVRLMFAVLGITILHVIAYALNYGAELRLLIVITSIIMVMDAFTAFFYAVFRARQNLFYEAIGTAIFQIIVVSVGLYTLAQTNDLKRLLLVIAIGSFWHLVYSLSLLRRKTDISFIPNFDFQLMKTWIIKAAPFFMAAGFIKIYNTIDTIFLKNMVGDEAVGLYAIPAKVVFTFPFIALAVTAAVYPAMSSYAIESKERLQSIFSRTLILLLTISAPIAAGIFLLADPIITRVWPEFKESIPALQILIWAVVFLYIEYPFGSLLNATGNERRNTINRGIQLAAFIVLNLILIPLYGFMGAVYSALFCSILIVLLGWLKARRLIGVLNKNFLIVLLKLGLSVLAMAEVVKFGIERTSFLAVIPIAGIAYLIMLIVLKVYNKDDWKWVRSVISNR